MAKIVSMIEFERKLLGLDSDGRLWRFLDGSTMGYPASGRWFLAADLPVIPDALPLQRANVAEALPTKDRPEEPQRINIPV